MIAGYVNVYQDWLKNTSRHSLIVTGETENKNAKKLCYNLFLDCAGILVKTNMVHIMRYYLELNMNLSFQNKGEGISCSLLADWLFCHVFAGVSFSRMIVVTLGKYSGFIMSQFPIFPLKSEIERHESMLYLKCLHTIFPHTQRTFAAQ